MLCSGARTKMLQYPNYFENLVNLFEDYPDYFINTIELVRYLIPKELY